MRNKIAYVLLVLFMLVAVVACNNDNNEISGNYTVIEEAIDSVAHVKTDKYFYFLQILFSLGFNFCFCPTYMAFKFSI